MTLYKETYRPQYHFSAKEGWINDPNGLVFYKGEYHLFFQHNPFGTDHGNMTWGHAISKDLVHWEQLENKLLPDEMGTMFSGSAVVDWNNTTGFQTGDEKVLVAIYTAAGGTSPESEGQPFTQCLAYSNDRGRSWTKYQGNPVLENLAKGNRDPKVFWHKATQRWIMTLFMKEDCHFAFFSSPDLKTWRHLQDMETEGTRECPDFFEIAIDGDTANKKWVWTGANGCYFIGSFDGYSFTPESELLTADWGNNFYAVQTYSDIPEEDGRRIQIAWMWRKEGQYPDMPFNHQMNFPNELLLKTSSRGIRLVRQPIKEIEGLYNKTHSFNNLSLEPSQNPLANIDTDLIDMSFELELGTASGFTLNIRGTEISYNAKTKELSCLDKIAVLGRANNYVQLRLLLDRTSIELFVNEGETCMSFCFLHEGSELSMTVPDGKAQLRVLVVHELNSAWE